MLIFMFTLWIAYRLSTACSESMWSSKVDPHSTVSSQYATHVFHSSPLSTNVSALAYVAVAFVSPNGIRLNLSCPCDLVPKAVLSLSSGCSSIDQNALELSSVDMYFAPPSASSDSSILAKWETVESCGDVDPPQVHTGPWRPILLAHYYQVR